MGMWVDANGMYSQNPLEAEIDMAYSIVSPWAAKLGLQNPIVSRNCLWIDKSLLFGMWAKLTLLPELQCKIFGGI